MKRTVKAQWDGYYWVGIDGSSGAATQAKRLALLPGRISESIHLMTGETVDACDVELDIAYEGEAASLARDVRELRHEVEQQTLRLHEATTRAIIGLRAEGMTERDIATLTGLSHQRVHQILRRDRSHLKSVAAS
jgi:DNA-directed RNA polymerase specialized sigma24 family protein